MADIVYHNETTVSEEDLTLTLLEISLNHGIPHMHACGGNARCSTCRVMVLDHAEHLHPRNAAEQRLAQKKGLEDNIRLACQTRTSGPVTIRRLVYDDEDVNIIVIPNEVRCTGQEKQLAIMFTDIRSFTVHTEKHLPYDVIHILNRYFDLMGEAIVKNQGYIDKYIGDGMMALFGVSEEDPASNCLNAIMAGLEMVRRLEDLNVYLRKHFDTEFRIGVGIHFGEVILGDMGHPRKRQFTAIGDAVNMASRVEGCTKKASTPILISEAVNARARGEIEVGNVIQTGLKGKRGYFKLYEVRGLGGNARNKRRALSLSELLTRKLNEVITLRESPLFLRLAYHDAITYDPRTSLGGANGSVHLPAELSRPENRGTAEAIQKLESVKEDFPEVSWADLIALAGAVAVSRTGGPDIDMPLGRQDAVEPDPEGMLPSEESDAEELKTRFARMGFSVQDLVALSGAHTLGKAHGKPFTEDLFSFTNSYYVRLLKEEGDNQSPLLRSDKLLATDAECRIIVEKYAVDQDAFFRDFASAYRRMTMLGTDLQA